MSPAGAGVEWRSRPPRRSRRCGLRGIAGGDGCGAGAAGRLPGRIPWQARGGVAGRLRRNALCGRRRRRECRVSGDGDVQRAGSRAGSGHRSGRDQPREWARSNGGSPRTAPGVSRGAGTRGHAACRIATRAVLWSLGRGQSRPAGAPSSLPASMCCAQAAPVMHGVAPSSSRLGRAGTTHMASHEPIRGTRRWKGDLWTRPNGQLAAYTTCQWRRAPGCIHGSPGC